MTHVRQRLIVAMLLAVAPACTGSGAAAPSTQANAVLRYTAAIDPRGDASAPIVARLTVTNISGATQRIEFAPCPYHSPVWVRAYATESGRLAWDSNAAYQSATCIASVARRTLDPGDSTDFHLAIPASLMFGDSLPNGRYRFTVTPEYLTPPSSTELPAGGVDVAR